MYYIIKSSRGKPVIMDRPQPDAQEIGRALRLENAQEISDEFLEALGGKRLATMAVICAAIVALVSGVLL
jgi:hypothetical protein